METVIRFRLRFSRMSFRSQSKLAVEKMVLLPFSSSLRIIVVFSIVAARSLLAGFERLNREVQVLLHSMSLHSILKKEN